jgi:hypothetical protein
VFAGKVMGAVGVAVVLVFGALMALIGMLGAGAQTASQRTPRLEDA